MYGRGAGVTGVGTTVAGVAVLPNTSGSIALTVLSVVTIAAGLLVTSSFVYARVAAKMAK